jgi:isoquinoline 1-oxidoreductase beta subunit
MAGAELDFRHGLGEAMSAQGARDHPQETNQMVFDFTQKMPYNLGRRSLSLREKSYGVPTGAFRSVYSGTVSTVNEIVIDELARKLGRDEYEFRRARLDNDRGRTVLDRVAREGRWGKDMPAGTAGG